LHAHTRHEPWSQVPTEKRHNSSCAMYVIHLCGFAAHVDNRKQLLIVLRLTDIPRVTAINLKVTGSYPEPSYLSGKPSQTSFSKCFNQTKGIQGYCLTSQFATRLDRVKAKAVRRRDGPCGICGGRSGTDTGLSLSSYFSFHLSVSFHRSSTINSLSPTLYNITN
jgi:hypothetical protein